jgi:hypothetical protein
MTDDGNPFDGIVWGVLFSVIIAVAVWACAWMLKGVTW